jgi:hypothetical protein
MTMRKRRPLPPLPTPEQASRALYLDFESEANRPPALSGVRVDGQALTWIHLPVLQEAAKAKEHLFLPLPQFLEQLMARAEREDRLIIHWSQAEPLAAAEAGVPLLTVEREQPYAGRALDLKKLAKMPFKKQFDRRKALIKRSPRGRHHPRAKALLSHCAASLGFERHPGYGPGLVGKRLRDVGGQLERRGSWDSLTPVAKAKWTKLLRHNDYDCEAMEVVLRRLTEVRHG